MGKCCEPGRTVLTKAREKIDANLGNVNFWLLALWELVDGRKNKSDRTRNNLCGERLEGQKMSLIKGSDRNPAHVVHSDSPGMESAAQFGYPKCQ